MMIDRANFFSQTPTQATKPKVTGVTITKRCPQCGRRLLDRLTACTGMIELKCPKCGGVARLDMALRRASGK